MMKISLILHSIDIRFPRCRRALRAQFHYKTLAFLWLHRITLPIGLSCKSRELLFTLYVNDYLCYDRACRNDKVKGVAFICGKYLQLGYLVMESVILLLEISKN